MNRKIKMKMNFNYDDRSLHSVLEKNSPKSCAVSTDGISGLQSLNLRIWNSELLNGVYSLRLIHRSVGKHFVHLVVEEGRNGKKWTSSVNTVLTHRRWIDEDAATSSSYISSLTQLELMLLWVWQSEYRVHRTDQRTSNRAISSFACALAKT